MAGNLIIMRNIGLLFAVSSVTPDIHLLCRKIYKSAQLSCINFIIDDLVLSGKLLICL